jgi:hypothetical protein
MSARGHVIRPSIDCAYIAHNVAEIKGCRYLSWACARTAAMSCCYGSASECRCFFVLFAIRKVPGTHDKAFKSRRSRSGSTPPNRASASACVLCQTGTALSSKFHPLEVRLSKRPRLSAGSIFVSTKPRRTSGFRAAVSVVRSIARGDATDPMPGGSERLSDISKENCPFVSSSGRKASSKRRAKARDAR